MKYYERTVTIGNEIKHYSYIEFFKTNSKKFVAKANEGNKIKFVEVPKNKKFIHINTDVICVIKKSDEMMDKEDHVNEQEILREIGIDEPLSIEDYVKKCHKALQYGIIDETTYWRLLDMIGKFRKEVKKINDYSTIYSFIYR